MQNKPNFPNAKIVLTAFYTMTNNNGQRTMNYSKQTQTKPNKLEANLAEIPTGELFGILKPRTKQSQFIVSLVEPISIQKIQLQIKIANFYPHFCFVLFGRFDVLRWRRQRQRCSAFTAITGGAIIEIEFR